MLCSESKNEDENFARKEFSAMVKQDYGVFSAKIEQIQIKSKIYFNPIFHFYSTARIDEKRLTKCT